jgi:hypothetical protein
MSDLGEKNDDAVKNEKIDSDDETMNEVIRVVKTKLSQRQKKELGLVKPKTEYKRQRTPAQLAHDERLRQINRENAEILKKEKAEYEEAQLKNLHFKLEEKNKRKNNVPSFDEEEYQKWLEFKSLSVKKPTETKPTVASPKAEKKKKEKAESESEDDGAYQSKTKKAQKIIQQVEQIENKINKLSVPVNPYLELFNKMKK